MTCYYSISNRLFNKYERMFTGRIIVKKRMRLMYLSQIKPNDVTDQYKELIIIYINTFIYQTYIHSTTSEHIYMCT